MTWRISILASRRLTNGCENGRCAMPKLAATKTYVICPTGSHQVGGYYAVCMGQVLNQDAVGSIRRNMPMHIPAGSSHDSQLTPPGREKGSADFCLLTPSPARCARPARSRRGLSSCTPSPPRRRHSIPQTALRGCRVRTSIRKVGAVNEAQALSRRKAFWLRSTMWRELGKPIAASDTSCDIVRDTVSIVSPR